MLATEVFNQVNTILRKKMSVDYPDLSFSDTIRNEELPSLPCLYIGYIGSPQVASSLRQDEQLGIKATFQIEAYSNESIDDARYILDSTGNILVKMGFQMIYGIVETSTSDMWRVIARFQKICMSGESFLNT